MANDSALVPITPAMGRTAQACSNTAECILWWGALNEQGYGTIFRSRRSRQAHRVIYEECFGPIPHEAVVHHRCHNRACVNPEHLELKPSARDHGLTHAPAPERTLWQLRVDRGLSLTDLEALSGVRKAYLSQIERGRMVPTGGQLDQLATALGLSAGSLALRTMVVHEESA